MAFIPMLMGTGGNSGAQASTAVIRSLSLGDTEPKDALKVMWKEWRVALLCGLTLAAVNFGKMLLVDGLLLHNDAGYRGCGGHGEPGHRFYRNVRQGGGQHAARRGGKDRR